MISICESTSLPSPQTYQSPGGFIWWYLDIRDPQGNGIVLIWAFGLPFLPNYASQARQGNGPKPIERPSLNLSVYKQGKLDFYLLQEYDPTDCDSTEHHWRFKESLILFEQVSGCGQLKIELNCPIPNSSETLTGHIQFDGPLRKGTFGRSDPTHQWTPIMVAAEGSVHLKCGKSTYEFSGRGYHDRNAGTHPLHELDIDTWWWGRLAFEESELIFYALFPKKQDSPLFLALEVDQEGNTHKLQQPTIRFTEHRRSLYGMRWSQHLEISLTENDTGTIHIDLNHKIEDGPFYQRFMCEARCDTHGTAYGYVEQILPDKVDLDWMRPLVKMRVHQLGKDNSMWLPLFTGPRRERLKRLFQGSRE